MDLLAILNLEDVTPYGPPSTPSPTSSSSVGTPKGYSPSMSFESRSEYNGRRELLEKLRLRTGSSNSKRDEWPPTQFTVVYPPRDGRCQESSLAYTKKNTDTSFDSNCWMHADQHSRRARGRQHYGGTHESRQTQRSQSPCVESSFPSPGAFCEPRRLSSYPRSPFRSLTSSQQSLRSQAGGCPPEPINLYHTIFSQHQTTKHSSTMSSGSPVNLPGISEICKSLNMLDLKQDSTTIFSQDVRALLTPDIVPSGLMSPMRTDGLSEPQSARIMAELSSSELSELSDVTDSADDGESDEEEEKLPSGSQKCTYMSSCNLESPDRRVISHFFGRNKKETRAIPDECWVCYCRQHYQRARYRQSAGAFAQTQMRLVRETVEKLEEWEGVVEWHIAIRKRNAEMIAQEDAAAAQAAQQNRTAPEQTCRERVLLPYVGKNKSFADVYAVITTVEDYSRKKQTEALEFELVPQYRPGYLANGKTSGKRRGSKPTAKRARRVASR